jgi:hypothetical protein
MAHIMAHIMMHVAVAAPEAGVHVAPVARVIRVHLREETRVPPDMPNTNFKNMFVGVPWRICL